MNDLITKVIAWANERNIIQGSSVIKQLDKTSEEFNELQRAVALHINPLASDYEEHFAEVVDAFGDILVTLIIAAKMLDIDLYGALSAAWNQIKDRKGRLVNGLFIKEEDL